MFNMTKKKIENKGLNFIVDLKVYPFDIMFSFGQTDTQFKKALTDRCDVPEHEFEDRLFCFDKHPTKTGRTVMLDISHATVIRLNHIPSTPFEFSQLQHEIFHGITFILYTIGMPFTRDSEEGYAYLIQYVTEQVYNHIFVHTIDKNKKNKL